MVKFVNKQCIVTKCDKMRYNGDSLFCPECRQLWIIFCGLNGIKDRDVQNDIVEDMLKQFIDWKSKEETK